MTLVRCALAILVLTSSATAAAEPGPTLDQFDWLVGSWEREVGDGVSIEEWTRVSANVIEGTTVVRIGDALEITEHLRIERFGDRIYYIALPGENAMPTPFELVQHEQGRWVFENPEHDFPTRIIYLSLDATHLRVRIEGPGGEGGIDFDFVRR
jgi:hypothetical protein